MRLEVFDHLDSTELRIRTRGRDDLTATLHDTVDYEPPKLRRGRPRKQPDDLE